MTITDGAENMAKKENLNKDLELKLLKSWMKMKQRYIVENVLFAGKDSLSLLSHQKK